MLPQCKKNIFHFTAGKGMLYLFFLFFSVPARAQTDSLDADSTKMFIEEVPAEDQQSPDTTATTQRQYFLKKWGDTLTVEQRHVPDTVLKKMQQDDHFWYANEAIKKQKQQEKGSTYTPLGQRKWFQVLLWLVIIGGFVAVVMWWLAGSNVGLFRKKNVSTESDGGSEEIPEDIFAINYQKEIDKATEQGNYRLAIRLMFLRMLKELAEKNIIQYKPDRTNFDYLLQLQSTGYYTPFFRITRNYEYSWYGQFMVSEETFKIIRNDFSQFDRQLK